MKSSPAQKGFTLIEILVATAVFVLFAIGIYSGIHIIFKIVYNARTRILETAVLSEQLEIIRNLPYQSVGILNGVPSGLFLGYTSTTRNGMIFDIYTTIRNIDDPFDGMVTGTTQRDYSAADYKLVEMSVKCRDCAQQNPINLSTIVAPKQLEGSSSNGALFIQVFDALGLPLQGATVNVTGTLRTSTIFINDTTDSDGYLRIIDTPTGTQSYHINVSKSGYSSDYTVSSTASIPSPVRPPANVASQNVTDISFIIDRLGSMAINTINPACAAAGSILFNIHGAKILGIEPIYYKYNKNFTTDAGGLLSLSNMEFDKYTITLSGTTYDIGGTIPFLPIDLTPGLSQNVSVVLQPHTPNSLLAQVRDAATGLPISGATVDIALTATETAPTGIGYMRQTNWNGGSGQVLFTNVTKYFADNGNIANSSPAGDLKLKYASGHYLNSGWLESSTFDLGSAVNFQSIFFAPLSQPSQTGADPITYQIAVSNSSSPATWNYTGPDGTTSSYYSATTSTINPDNNGKRYFRYKVFLNTSNTAYTPKLSETYFTFTNGCAPPGQVFFNNLSAGTYVINVSKSGYDSYSGSVDVSGPTQVIVDMALP